MRRTFRCTLTARGGIVIEDPLLRSVAGGRILRHRRGTYYVDPTLPEVKEGCVEEMAVLLDAIAPRRTRVVRSGRVVRVVLRGV